MSTIDIDTIVRVRSAGRSGRPFQGTVTKLYANGTHVKVALNSDRGAEYFGSASIKVSLDDVTAV